MCYSSLALQDMGTTAESCSSKLEELFLQRVLVSACFLRRALKYEQLEKKKPAVVPLVPIHETRKNAEVNTHTSVVSYLLTFS